MFTKSFSITLILILSCVNLKSQNQTVQNFTFTDIDGINHNLYQTHLDQGKTVVIKFFFTTCPPCRANAPSYQAKNVEWGNNANDTKFMELSILTNDDNNKVRQYKNTFGMSVISAGSDGNSDDVANIFKSGIYGPWYGTPSFAVIGPDRTLYYPLFFDQLDEAIEATGAERPGNSIPDPTTVQLNIQSSISNYSGSGVKFYLKPANAATPKTEIVKNGNGQYIFEYPSSQFPEIVNPVIIMETTAPAYHSSVNAIDLINIQKHILGIKPFTLPEQTLAADVNADSKINAIDLINIQKVIIGTLTQFPNQVKSYRGIPDILTVVEDSGHTVQVNMKIVKIGNVN